MSNLVNYIDAVREMFDQSTIKVNAISLLPNVQVVIGIVEVVHPMIFTSTVLQ